MLREKTDINNIYIFSDDLNWCRNNFKLSSNFNNINITINFISLKTDIEELIFMSKFNNIIIANSSFSWWAACLDNNLEKNYILSKTLV